MKYEDVDFERVKKEYSELSVLIVTVTEIETLILQSVLKPVEEYKRIIRVTKNNQTYFIGIFGSYLIAHVRCNSMGSMLPGSSIMTISDAINIWSPKAIIMIGIAMGFNKKHKIGDVLVSETVSFYEQKRVGTPLKIYRGPKVQAGEILLNRFKNTYDWNFDEDLGYNPSIRFGEILSGENLVDNIDYKEELQQEFPEALGLEMEGAGLYTATKSKAVPEWILVKSICDYGDGKKNRNKKKNQTIATRTAISTCEHVLTNKYCLTDLGVMPYEIERGYKQNETYKNKIKEVLFDRYKIEFEQYYVGRSIDDEIYKSLHYAENIWAFGYSGTGKTAALTRSLLKNKKNFRFISLANCIINNNTNDLIKEIIFRLSEKSQIKYFDLPDNLQKLIDTAVSVILSLEIGSELFIFVEEIPLDGNSRDFENFAKAIFAIQIQLKYADKASSVKFILSSINNPFLSLDEFQMKIKEHFVEIHFNHWEDKDIEKLFDLISFELRLNSVKRERKKILAEVQRNPRLLKVFFRNNFLTNSYFPDSIV